VSSPELEGSRLSLPALFNEGKRNGNGERKIWNTKFSTCTAARRESLPLSLPNFERENQTKTKRGTKKN